MHYRKPYEENSQIDTVIFQEDRNKFETIMRKYTGRLKAKRAIETAKSEQMPCMICMPCV